MGRVHKVYPDDRGHVRMADIRIAKVKGELKPGLNTVMIQRPIAKLILLRSEDQV
jgi:hypothetical protein